MNYLITGGTGLVGKQLSRQLLAAGHQVSVLSRSKRQDNQITFYQWDLKKGEIESEALKNVDVLIHLAGAGIADKKWTDARKKEIITSRTEPLEFLRDAFQKAGEKPKRIVSASAIGIYGFDTGDKLLTEVHEAGNDYISKVVVDWEKAVDDFAKAFDITAVKLRIGIVLAKEGGALPQLALPVKLGVGSPIGDGKQWMSWIHINDLCGMFKEVSENEHFHDVYNAVSPNPEQNETIVKTLAEVLHRPLWAPNVPGFALKLLMGERAQLVLGGNKVASARIEEAGYKFEFPELKEALSAIYES